MLSRAVVLGGLVVAGWLLGSGIGFAKEDLGQSGTEQVQLASYLGEGSARPGPTQPESGSDGQLGVPPALGSALAQACSTVAVPRSSLSPRVRFDVLRPLANAVGAPKPLAQLLRPRPLVPHVLTLLQPGKPRAGTRSHPPAEKPTTAALGEPLDQSTAATASMTTRGFSAVPTVDRAPPATPLRAAVPAGHSAGWSAFDSVPAAPVPASPPASTTSSCVISSTGSGAGAKNAPDTTRAESWAAAEAALMYHLRQRSASDLPRSAATQPATSPD